MKTLSLCLAVGLVTGTACRRVVQEPPSRVFLIDQVPAYSGTFTRRDLSQLREQGLVSASVTLAGETRRCLAPPLPTHLRFAVELPPDPILRFDLAVGTSGRPRKRDLIEFKVNINSGNGERTCFKETVTRAQRNRWLARRVDLSRWSKGKAQIHLEVNPVPAGDGSSDDGEPLFPLWGNPIVSGTRSATGRPNLILISVDCLRPDHMGVYGYSRTTTPHIDAFAQEAVVFEKAVSTSSWTLPTHMSMMTGLTPSFHGASRTEKLPVSLGYLPDLLSRAGYETLGLATGAYLSQTFGFERGFHAYRVMVHPRAGRAVDEALDLLGRASGQGFFLFLHLFDPHWRYLPPEGFVERFGPRPADIERLLNLVLHRHPPTGPEDVEKIVRLYDGEIAYLDQEVGRFFAALKERGLFESSLIILTADHGEAFYEHGYWQHSDVLYEETIRIPLIVKWPGKSSHQRVKRLGSLLDICPTLMEAADLPRAHSMGRNLAECAESPDQDEPGREFRTVSETEWSSPQGTLMKVALRSHDRKYIATFAAGETGLDVGEMLKEELYHLDSDPGEKHSLNERGEIESFRRELFFYLEHAEAFLSLRQKGDAVALDGEVEEQLRNLGYVH